MIELSRFSLHYFSEVSADVLYRYRPKYGTYKISATHTSKNLPISCWFHFVDSDIDERKDPLYFESEDVVEPVAMMAGTLCPAGVDILENYEVEDPKSQFFTDFMCALAHGEYSIKDARSTEYIHPAGSWLLEEYRKI